MPQHNTIKLEAARQGVTVQELLTATLNAAPTVKEAAARPGGSYDTLYRYMRDYGVRSETRYIVKEGA